MIKASLISLTALILLVTSWNNSPAQSNTIKLNEKKMLVSDTSDGWGGDVTLSIVVIQNKEAGKKALTVTSSYNGTNVGFLLQLTPQKNKTGFHETGIEIKSLGKISDNFLHVLASIYKVKINSNLKFIESFNSTYANLDEIAGNKSQGIMTKLFLGDSNSERDYGEIYLDIYEKEGIVVLAEKDIEYRRAVIKAFSRK
jgi:hypothetical protein